MDDGVEDDFAFLVARARNGDEAATTQLLKQFEADVRMMVRVRLPRALRAQFDSMDFVQAVWASVFAGSKENSDAGSAFNDARQFRGFLAGVARNKVYEQHRRLTRTKKYDLGREERLYVRKGERDVPRDVPAHDPTPSENVQANDRYGQLVHGKSVQETRVVELRRQGLTFEEIAERVGWNERSVRRVIDTLRERMEARRWQ
jgi:RNA polymerase sigma-70 factor (ECF subfamily)